MPVKKSSAIFSNFNLSIQEHNPPAIFILVLIIIK